jgi:hypothetical protein
VFEISIGNKLLYKGSVWREKYKHFAHGIDGPDNKTNNERGKTKNTVCVRRKTG